MPPFQIKEVKSVNQMADKMDQRLVEQLLCALEERKDDNIHKIWVYPPVKIDDDHDYSAYVVMKNRGKSITVEQNPQFWARLFLGIDGEGRVFVSVSG